MKRKHNNQNDGQAPEIVGAQDYVADWTEALTTLDYAVPLFFMTLWEDYLMGHLNEGLASGSIDGGNADVLDAYIDGRADEALNDLAAQRKGRSPATLAGKRAGLIAKAKEQADISETIYNKAKAVYEDLCKTTSENKIAF